MILLGIDTTTTRSSVCVGGEEGPLATATLGRRQAHAELLAPAVRFCLEAADVTLDDLDAIAVTLGPGLYTGMRVGLVTAQHLAHARGLAVVGASSLDLVARAGAAAERPVTAVLDARRGELFWAHYAAGGRRRLSEERVGPPERLAGELEGGQPALCLGDGAARHAELLRSAGARVLEGWPALPTAEALVEAALPRLARGDVQAPGDLRARYLRAPDARIGWRNRGALHGGASEGAAAVGGGSGP